MRSGAIEGRVAWDLNTKEGLAEGVQPFRVVAKGLAGGSLEVHWGVGWGGLLEGSWTLQEVRWRHFTSPF